MFPKRMSHKLLSPDPVFRLLVSPQVLHPLRLCCFIDVFRLVWLEKLKHKHCADKSGLRSCFWLLNCPTKLLKSRLLVVTASCLYDIWFQAFCICSMLYESIFEICNDYSKQPNFFVKLTHMLFLIEVIILFVWISLLHSMKFVCQCFLKYIIQEHYHVSLKFLVVLY